MSESISYATQSLKQRLILGAAWVAFAMLVNALINFGSSMLLARLLEPDELGSYFLALSAVAIGAMVAQLGMARVMVRQVSDAIARNIPAESRRVIRTVLALAACASGIVGVSFANGIGCYVANKLLSSPHLLAVVPLVSVWIILATFQGLIPEAFRGLHDLRLASTFGGMISNMILVTCLMLLWLLNINVNLTTVLVITVTGVMLSLSLSGFLLYRRLTTLPWEPGWCLRKVVKPGIPILGAGFLMLAMRESHTWLLGLLASTTDVAQFGVVLRLILVVSMPLIMINQTIQSSIAHLHSKSDYVQLEMLLRGSSAIVVLLALPVLLVMLIWGNVVLGIMFGDYFIRSHYVLSIVIIGQTVNLWTGSPGVLLVMSGRERVQLMFVLAAAVCSIGVSVTLIPAYGIIGAAVGISAGLIMQNVMMWMYCWRTMGLRTDPSIQGFVFLWRQVLKQLYIYR